MKLLANENFPLDSVRYLKSKNYDVLAIGVDYAGISDIEVMRIAEGEKRIILTFDRDYGELIFKHNHRPSQGVIYLRLEQYDSNDPGILVEQLLKSDGFDTTLKLTVFDGSTVRQRIY